MSKAATRKEIESTATMPVNPKIAPMTPPSAGPISRARLLASALSELAVTS